MTDFRRLEAWQSSQKLAVVIYQLTTGFPATERFGLVSQMRRAAVSTMSNIAEADEALEMVIRTGRLLQGLIRALRP